MWRVRDTSHMKQLLSLVRTTHKSWTERWCFCPCYLQRLGHDWPVVTIPTLPTTPLPGLLEQHPPQRRQLRPWMSICPFPAHTHPRKRPGSPDNSHAKERAPHFHHWTCPQPGMAAAPPNDKPALKHNLNSHNLLYQVLIPLMPPVLWPFSKISGTSSRLRIANFN